MRDVHERKGEGARHSLARRVLLAPKVRKRAAQLRPARAQQSARCCLPKPRQRILFQVLWLFFLLLFFLLLVGTLPLEHRLGDKNEREHRARNTPKQRALFVLLWSCPLGN